MSHVPLLADYFEEKKIIDQVPLLADFARIDYFWYNDTGIRPHYWHRNRTLCRALLENLVYVGP